MKNNNRDIAIQLHTKRYVTCNVYHQTDEYKKEKGSRKKYRGCLIRSKSHNTTSIAEAAIQEEQEKCKATLNRAALPAVQRIQQYTIPPWYSNRKIVACRKRGKEKRNKRKNKSQQSKLKNAQYYEKESNRRLNECNP